MGEKWWTYQRERFPVIANGILILAFSSSAVCFSTLLRGSLSPSIFSIAVAFITSFIFFLQLRIADEFKDIEEDTRYRPYRAVPRGLVTLRELAVVFAAGALIQLVLALFHQPVLIMLLFITWIYLAGMSKEFFIKKWLKSQPLIYMVSHMAIMPLIDLYATSCDWSNFMNRPPHGLFWFLIASFFNGMVIEIGRKIRVPEDEEEGVETYTFLWGRYRAAGFWMLVMSLTFICAIIASGNIDFASAVAVIMGILLAAGYFIAIGFMINPIGKHGKMIEYYSGIWTLFLYLSLGLIPLISKAMGQA
ncbi:MAG TPA: UbiA family prenyltransferase [bacterium]